MEDKKENNIITGGEENTKNGLEENSKSDIRELTEMLGILKDEGLKRKYKKPEKEFLAYPELLFNNISNKNFKDVDYIIIYPIRYKPPFANRLTTESIKNDNEKRLLNYYEKYNQYKEEIVGEKILLPVPENISSNYSNEWKETVLTYTGRAILELGRDIAFDTGIEITPDSVAARIQNLSQGATTSITNTLISRLISVLGSSNKITEEGVSAGLIGGIPNPNVELTFGLPKLRSFKFSYTLIPFSENDAISIKKIIKALKKHMHPSLNYEEINTILSPGRFITAPSLFKIKFMRGLNENENLFKIKNCALVDLSVEYGEGSNYQTVMSDKNYIPNVIKLSATFMETKILYSEDFEENEF